MRLQACCPAGWGHGQLGTWRLARGTLRSAPLPDVVSNPLRAVDVDREVCINQTPVP